MTLSHGKSGKCISPTFYHKNLVNCREMLIYLYIKYRYICDVIVLFQVAHVGVKKVLICPEM